MPNTLNVTVENPDELLNAGAYGTGAVIRVQWSATEAGAYVDVSGTGSTPTLAILSGVRIYTGYDPLGIASTWYRTRYENIGATRVSDWTPSFQAGDETAGLLASLYDVKQDLGITGTSDDETLLEKLRQVSALIEGYCERWFAPRPTDPDSTATYRFDTGYGRRLMMPKGIRSITSLGIATSDQPETGGTYGVATATDYQLVPPQSVGWPSTSIRFRDVSSSLLYNAYYGVEITGAFGWAEVPYDIQAIAIGATIRRFMSKESAAPAVAIGPTGAVTLLRDISPADMARLEWYRAR